MNIGQENYLKTEKLEKASGICKKTWNNITTTHLIINPGREKTQGIGHQKSFYNSYNHQNI